MSWFKLIALGVFLLPILSAAQGSTVRIRAGSGAFTDGAGNAWAADNYFNTGSPYITTAAIDGTTDDALYQGERWDAAGGSELTYNIPVTPGAYKVRLHFAEIYFSAAGQRIFDVSVEGAVAFANLDVFAQAGAKNKALIKEYNVTVTDNTLTILFTHKTENPKISSIEILPAAAPAPVTPTPKLVATPASLSFGSVLLAQTSSLNVTLSNTGTASLSISGITLSGAQASQFKVTATPITIAAAATATLPVQFAPTVAGAAAATLTLVSNDPVTPSQTIALSGQGFVVTPPSLSVSPTSLTFAATTVGSTSANTNIILTNTGGSALTVSALTLSGAHSGDFAFTAPALPLTIAPAATAALPVRFAPTAAGARSASLAIASNQSAGNVNVTLAGTGNAVTPPPATPPASALSTVRIRTGGGAFTDGAGNAWAADNYFNTGSPYITTAAIDGTTDDALYQGERWDAAGGSELTYNIPVTPGAYKVRLHFAEIYFSAAGQRIFDVSVEGAVAFANLDVFAQAGAKNKALIKEYNVTVTDNTLTILFTHKTENPKISSIEILPATTTAPPAPVTPTPPSLSVNPTSLTFAATTVGSTSANTNIILTNTGGSALTVSALTLSGAHSGDFAFTAPALPLTIAPAATAALPVRFSPTSAGARSASLAIASNQTAGNVNVTLAGTGNAVTPPPVVTPPVIPPSTAQPTHRIIAGGPSYTDVAGNVWSADKFFNTGEPFVSTGSIEGTPDIALYQTERWDAAGGDELTYAIPVTAGIYKIRLHFAEIYFAAPGLRVFDVAIDDQVVFPNLDIFAQASGKNKALVKEIEVTVNTDTLYISFLHKIENPKINALEILPLPNSHSHPFLHVSIQNDSLVVDHDGDGIETVRFDGSSSHTHELGKILVSRKWKLNQVALLDAVRVDIDLPLGTHSVTLEIADNNTPPQTLSGSESVQVVSPDWVPGALMHFYSSVGDPSPWLDAPPAKADFAQIQPRLFLSPATAPVAPPFLATYSARLDLAASGVYNFSLNGGSSRRLFINGAPVTGPMNLAIGVYALEARVAVNASDISPLEVTYSLGESPLSPIPTQIIFHSEAGLKPVVNAVSGEGSKEGGFPVQISGLGFFPRNQVQVHLGNQVFQGSSLLLTSSSIQFTAPPGSGNVEGTVVTPQGTSKTFVVKYNDGPSTLISFVSYALTSQSSPTQAVWGPDGRLYVSSINGTIKAYTLGDDYQIISEQTIATIANLPNNEVLGLAFNPLEAQGPVKLYVAHSKLHGNGGVCFTGISDYNGQVSVLTGPNFTSAQPLITKLPVSNHDHGPSGMEFDNKGDLLLTVGGNTNAGIAACNLGNVPESPLSSSIVKAQLSKPGFNGAITYLTPSGNVTADQAQGGTANLAAGLDLSVFASGLRNTYDLTLTTTNQIYATDNGPNFGFGPSSTSATSQGAEVEADDELNLIVQGAYYGHPNRNRGRTDNRQNAYYAPGAANVPGVFTQAMVFVPASTNGIVEYRAQTFGGALRGKLILQKWDGATYQVALSPDGKSVTSVLPLPVDLLGLDVTAGPGGALISADYSKNRVVIAKPITSVIGFQAYDIFPWRASSEGGAAFEIGGEGFGNMGNTTVTLGGVSATLTSVSPTRIKGIVPHKVVAMDTLEDVAVTVGGITKVIPKAFLFIPHVD